MNVLAATKTTAISICSKRASSHFLKSCLTLACSLQNQKDFQRKRFATQTPVKKLFVHQLDPIQTDHAMKNAHRSVRGNIVDSRRIYWFNVYLEVLRSSRLLLVVQNNNLSAQNYKAFKSDLASKHLECLAVRNGVFGAACTQSGKQELRNLFQGPILVIFSSATDSQAPDLIKHAAGILKKQETNTLLVGGCMDDFIFSAQKFEEIKALPSKIQILGELLGLIQYPASAVTQMLSQTPQVLAASLDHYQKDLNKK